MLGWFKLSFEVLSPQNLPVVKCSETHKLAQASNNPGSSGYPGHFTTVFQVVVFPADQTQFWGCFFGCLAGVLHHLKGLALVRHSATVFKCLSF